jgi:hypothetical protein
MSRRASLVLSLVIGASGLTAADSGAAPPLDAKAAFEHLKSLAGTWQGPAGHGARDQQATVVYRLASGGSVVQETLFPDTPHEMISMYHLADGQLVMTHYCAMGNQPRMRLDAGASGPDRLVFAFDGGSNLDPAKDAHVHSGVLEWKGDTLRADWTVWSGGKATGQNSFELKRAR